MASAALKSGDRRAIGRPSSMYICCAAHKEPKSAFRGAESPPSCQRLGAHVVYYARSFSPCPPLVPPQAAAHCSLAFRAGGRPVGASCHGK
eukprot:9501778-Pyramimonas_sp.AAC.1